MIPKVFKPHAQVRRFAVGRLLSSVALSALLVACGGEYSGDDASGLSAQSCGVAVVAQGAFPPAGQQQYEAQCASCHSSSGIGTPTGPSLVGCATCGDVSTLANRIATTMPLADAEACGVDCANDTAEYIMAVFNSGNAVSAAGLSCSLEGVTLEDPTRTLYRASLSLAGRLPTESELQTVRGAGESGLSQVLDTLLEEDAFYARLREIYNDVLHQDKYLPGEDALNLLNSTDYPQRKWYTSLGLDTSVAGPQRDLYYALRDRTNDGVSQEALRLVSHVVKNNRPFTEILTADYMLANRYSAQAYGVNGQAAWENAATPLDASYPEDPEDFREVRIPGIPHAGVLTSAMFLNRFPTTDTNLNRHRSRMVFSMFLDTDILAIPGSRPEDAIDLVSTTPTLDNPSCVSCHTVMDPVASTFQNWDERGRYRPSRLFDGWPTDILPRGISGRTMPLSGYADSSLQWLGKEIARDPRFARATVKTLYKGLTGADALPIPPADASAEETEAYLTQRDNLGKVERDFIAANYNLKTAIKGLVLSPYYRSASISGASADSVGVARLMTPEMLDRKITVVTGSRWAYSWSARTHLDKENSGGFNPLYGGMDSNNITTRLTHPNGLMAAVQQRMAVEMACEVTAKDFYYPAAQRKLFPYVEREQVPFKRDNSVDATAGDAILRNLVHLHWVLFGEQVATADASVQRYYDLYQRLLASGQAVITADYYGKRNLHYACDFTRLPDATVDLPDNEKIVRDEQFGTRAWQGVLTAMLNDFRFLYE